MIFTSVFGFANSPSAYYLMGYGDAANLLI